MLLFTLWIDCPKMFCFDLCVARLHPYMMIELPLVRVADHY